ncbi:Vgb family protein [Nocardioides nitrophenolicus]|uniref:Vgb family protein n=1 Tax=Nocardioides nitrophenolicus TaxID=60489 RepID=UPI0019567FC1|nr:hypothetical protein [Nocardioides nitrophenolicus]MBM7515879.1 virginiamycin B lyase [Nocardioides nitrophenolicus]
MRVRTSVVAVTGALLIASSAGVAEGAARADRAAAAAPTAPAAPAAGPTLATYPVPTAGAGLESLTRGPDGSLWFAEEKGWKIGRITVGGAIQEFPVAHDPGQSSGPTDLVAGGDGDLWFLSHAGANVNRMPTSGAYLDRFSDGYAQFGAITAGRSRGVWVSELGGDHTMYRLLGVADGQVEGWQLPNAVDDRSVPMALAPDGALWYGDGGNLERLGEDRQATTHPAPWGGSLSTGSLAYGADGALWATGHEVWGAPPFATYRGGAIGRFDGSRFVSWALPRLAGQSGDPVPHSLELGPDGALWWAEAGAIGRITPGGEISRASIAPWNATDIEFGGDGRLWFIDRAANRVGAITVDAHLFPPRQVARVVKLRAVAGGRAKGRVVAEPACRAGAVVAYAKPRKGKARKIGTGRAKASGRFTVKLRRRAAGKVFVKVRASAPTPGVQCLEARSRAR